MEVTMIDANAFINLMNSQHSLPFYSFLIVFALMALWEWKATRREEKVPRVLRWPNNLILPLINLFLIRVIFPGATLWAAYLAYRNNFGLFYWQPVPAIFGIIFTIIVMDWIVYYQHRLYHAVPWLWKIHRMHHTDLEVDVTTGFRFHPLEMIVSTLIKAFFIVLLGAPIYGVFLFEIIYNAAVLFNHSNIKIPTVLEKILRFILVTPDMHRIHHSAAPKETNSNYGFIFSLWDRCLGSYRPEPAKGQEKMKIGLGIFNDPQYLQVDKLLLQPFFDEKGHFAFQNLTQKD